MVGASEQTEEAMKLITLASRSVHELHVLRREVFNDLARSVPGSAERRTALASLETLDAELRARALKACAPAL